MLVSPVNFSEGRRLEVVEALAESARRFCYLLDVHSDPDHNRSVVTLAGDSGLLVEGILATAKEALARIDLNQQSGAHPRMGVIDVVPFVDLPAPSAEAVAASHACAERIWEELEIPCFLYADSATGIVIPLGLPAVRKQAFRELAPFRGGPAPHPTAGAVVLGARGLLVAYNMNLDTDDIRPARRIAAHLRQQLESVRSLALPLPSKGLVQVSCNLTSPLATTIRDVYEVAAELAAGLGVGILESEVAGLVPRQAFGGASPASLRFSKEPKLLEDCLERLEG